MKLILGLLIGQWDDYTKGNRKRVMTAIASGYAVMVPVMLLLSVVVSKFFGSCRFEEFRFKSGMVKVEVQHERYNHILITSLCAA